MYIFQLPAISGVRELSVPPPLRRGVLERLHAGQNLALDELERRAAAGREVIDAVLQAEARERGGRVAPAHHREARRGGNSLGDGARPGGERLQLESSHRPVPEHGARLPDHAGVPLSRGGPDVEADPAVGDIDAVEHAVLGVLGEAVADHEVDRQLDARAARSARPRERRARVLGVLLAAQRVAHRVTLRVQEREAHRAADHERVGELEEAVDDGDLVRHLRPADDRDERMAGMLEDRPQRAHLAFEQAPRGAGQQVRDALRARVGAVRHAERIVDVDVRQLRQRPCELGIVARLARLEAHVLEQQDLAVAQAFAERAHLGPDDRRERASRARP